MRNITLVYIDCFHFSYPALIMLNKNSNQVYKFTLMHTMLAEGEFGGLQKDVEDSHSDKFNTLLTECFHFLHVKQSPALEHAR